MEGAYIKRFLISYINQEIENFFLADYKFLDFNKQFHKIKNNEKK